MICQRCLQRPAHGDRDLCGECQAGERLIVYRLTYTDGSQQDVAAAGAANAIAAENRHQANHDALHAHLPQVHAATACVHGLRVVSAERRT